MMCALTAGKRGRKVLLLDHADEPGKKILISGGGRCNFTNLHCEPDAFLSQNPHFCKSALARYTQFDFIEMVDRHKIAWHEKTLGQLFCDGSARQIVKMLLEECEAVDVELRLSQTIKNISKGERFELLTEGGVIEAETLVLATGGLSIPKMGATGFAHQIAKQFKLKLIEPRPGLVPLTFAAEDLAWMKPLSGVSVEARVWKDRASFDEAVLMTHRGLSGPAILQISSYWRGGEAVQLNLHPGEGLIERFLKIKKQNPKRKISTETSSLFPKRLADNLINPDLANKPFGEVSDRDLETFANQLQAMRITPSGTEGFRKAEVTVGGVSTVELSSKAMEARKVPGLYFIGEAVDVTGWLGGYNFQWAWSSGHAAGEVI